MRKHIFSILQRVGRSFMLPIALLPVAGLFLGIGSSFTNAAMLSAYNLNSLIGPGTAAYTFLSLLSGAGSVIFDNLPILFAIGVAIGMAKTEKSVAALSSMVAFFVMHSTIGQMIIITGSQSSLINGATTDVVGITSLQMGVFGGIIVGLGVAALHNRFYKIELPMAFSFFGGTHFIPIISAIVYLCVGILMFYIWPPVQQAINAAGQLVLRSGYGGTFFYGLMERALIPFGLHHVFYIPFWQTALGGSEIIQGQLIEGAQNIFFAELATPGISHFNVSATRFMSGKFPLMIFGLPGAALAMYSCARTERKKAAASLLLSAAITSALTGITEPLEFTFLFAAPFLYAIHCVLAGLSYMLMHIFHVGVGLTFSGGLIDLTLFGILQGNAKTSWYNIILIGCIYFVVYFIVFRLLILKFNYQTPGREKENADSQADSTAQSAQPPSSGLSSDILPEDPTAANDPDADSRSAAILQGLGGIDNICDVDCCATRLRITVNEPKRVSKAALTATGAAAVITNGTGVQIVYGPQVTLIQAALNDYIQSVVRQTQPGRQPMAFMGAGTGRNTGNGAGTNNGNGTSTSNGAAPGNGFGTSNDNGTVSGNGFGTSNGNGAAPGNGFGTSNGNGAAPGTDTDVEADTGNGADIDTGAGTSTSANTGAAADTAPQKDFHAIMDEQNIDTVYSPCSGCIIPLSEINDGVFSEGYIGDGLAIEPSDGVFYAPFDCKVAMVFETRHAIVLHTAKETELILHVGLDTLQLKGEPFEVFVSEGQKLKKGDLLMKADLDKIRAAGYRTITPVVITAAGGADCTIPLKIGETEAGEKIMEVTYTHV